MFESFFTELTFILRLFREIFAKIQQFVNVKFGKDNNSPLVLDFIFFKFICPAIIHPKKYGLISGKEQKYF
jgi:hypothetical protein